MQSSQTDIQEQKAAARKYFFSLRRSFDSEYARIASQKICDGIYSLIKEKNIKTVLAYFPICGEVDILPLMKKLWGDSITVAFPRSITSDTHLDFYVVNSTSELHTGEYNIPEPVDTCKPLADFSNALCIVPALSADSSGFRLGYGKGYYDRFLCLHSMLTVCPLYSLMLSETIPHEHTDIPVDIIQTEKEVIFSRV